ncbi:hypothetical protein LTR70_002658 [Exophiala xenobiotica]|uniref:J domain-containing protein n=1 Tax=Lithohypha guttulata TaxID=1690604 RepID=A0ABR0JXU5_9EURO|nr:hypothetical protein LTR24_009797 [Lithohypha guttulata]KAK5325277.1 hypothetical protein LTR70_002658 [Exophiala xenobiotica]
MADSAIVPLLSYLGWSFLPNLGTQVLQNIYYRITISAGVAHPQPGTSIYARDHRRIRVLVLSLYLLYTLAQSLYDVKIAGDFYTLLSVDPHHTTEKEIKTRLRRLAARFHPDKVSQSADGTTNDEQSRMFLQLRLAGETLTNPSHRYAYTHFGPGILTHLPKPEENTTTTAKQLSLQTAQLVTLALKQKLPSYISTLVFIFVLNTFFLPGKQGGKFWRYLVISGSFVLECYLLTRDVPALPGALDIVVTWLRTYTKLGDLLPPHLLPFQLLDVSGRLALSLNIFISQISVLFPAASGALPPGGEGSMQMRGWVQQLNSNLANLAGVSNRIDQEAGGLLQLQFAPYKGQPAQVRELRRGMKEGMVMGSVRSHPEVREAVRRVVERRKAAIRGGDGGSAARGDGADVVDLLNSDEQFM